MAKIELIDTCKHFKAVSPQMNYVKQLLFPINEPPESNFSIENINLTIPDGKTLAILGPSGCGKTTLLRVIAGLEKHDSGAVEYDGLNMDDSASSDRHIGMVFQNYALYPHQNSNNNILSNFIFKKKSPALAEEVKAIYQRTSELMGVDIEHLLNKAPRNLSGGEKQRIAIARCITRNPALFLMDEPFANLDQKLREKYRVHLRTLLKQFAITTVYVTHDQQEAQILGDFVAVMSKGKVEQVGTYEEIYKDPNSIYVAEFLDVDPYTPAINLIDGHCLAKQYNNVTIGVRPEDIDIFSEMKADYIKAKIIGIEHIEFKRMTIFRVNIGEEVIYASLPLRDDLSINDDIGLHFKKFHLFDKQTGLRILNH